jgi:hypothetical protein
MLAMILPFGSTSIDGQGVLLLLVEHLPVKRYLLDFDVDLAINISLIRQTADEPMIHR